MKRPLVIGISGSPRIGGNTETLLDKALLGAKNKGAETEKVILNNLRMRPCQECEDVKGDGTCKVEDDFQPLYGKIKKAGALIIASPIFFGSLSAQTKIMIDRFQCSWRYKCKLKKSGSGRKRPGALILVESSTRDDFLQNAKSIIRNLFTTVDVGYREELFCQGIDAKGEILKHPGLLEKAFNMGKQLIS